MRTLKVSLVAMIALFIGVATMSFRLATPEQTTYVWFERVGVDEYEVMNDGVPTEEPLNGCIPEPDPDELCAKGFVSTGTIPPVHTINDETSAEDRYHPEPAR